MASYLNNLVTEASKSRTANGAVAYSTTQSDCLDLFSEIGIMRKWDDVDIVRAWEKAWAEDKLTALKLLFYARDVRGGLGERRVFRVIISHIAETDSTLARHILPLIPIYGRFDDMLEMMTGGGMDDDVAGFLHNVMVFDKGDAKLCAKWLPSINASSPVTIARAKRIASLWGLNQKQYRQFLTLSRKGANLLENYLRMRDYTFDYSKLPSQAMMKYKRAFLRNDYDRYCKYLDSVEKGEQKINTKTLTPYQIVHQAENAGNPSDAKALDVMWKNLPDYTNGENALVVRDGSGSMYGTPLEIATSLAIYFAERNTGAFHNYFMTFSANPKMVKIPNQDIVGKVDYCMRYDDWTNTDLVKVFDLLLKTAIKNNVPQEELPKTLYIISDMEFDMACGRPDSTIFEHAKEMFELNGYKLPTVVFWKVSSITDTNPVKMDDTGAVLVSGSSPTVFQMVIENNTNPYEFMKKALYSERYAQVTLPFGY